MHISVILGHPEKGSLNHAIADTVVGTLQSSGHGVFFHDLYAEQFDPILPSIEIARDAYLNPCTQAAFNRLVNGYNEHMKVKK